MIARLLQTIALLPVILSASKSVAETACVAQWNVLKIGMVPNNPLVAEAWVSFWDVPPNGDAILKDRRILFRIARDSAGRVSIRLGSSPDMSEPNHWMTTICDPLAKSDYSFQSNGDSNVIKSERGGIPGSRRSTGFSSPPSVARGGQQILLGAKTLLGYPASGYKTWNSQNGAIDSVPYVEQWFSENLALELSHWDVESGMRADVTRIDRQEPDASLMTVPPTRKIVDR